MSPRREKFWVRLSREEADYLREIQRELGIPTLGEALRFLVQYCRWTHGSERILIPREALRYLTEGDEGG